MPVHFRISNPPFPSCILHPTHLFPPPPASRSFLGAPASGPAPQSGPATPELQYSFTPFRVPPLLHNSNTPFSVSISPSCHPWLDKGCPPRSFLTTCFWVTARHPFQLPVV